MSIWNPIPDFNHLSYDGQANCAVCGSDKAKTDEFVFRPPTMDHVSGFFDICASCIGQGADDLGWLEPDRATAIAAAADKAHAEAIALADQLAAARDALATVTRENVRLQEAIDDLNSPVEVSFDEVDENDLQALL